MNVCAKFHCSALCIKKALGIFRELITTRTTTRVAFWDPPSGSKKYADTITETWYYTQYAFVKYIWPSVNFFWTSRGGQTLFAGV